MRASWWILAADFATRGITFIAHKGRPVVFACSSLASGKGGIAAWSRQIALCLSKWAADTGYPVRVLVLNAEDLEDFRRLESGYFSIESSGGKRWRFSLAVATCRAGLILFDHVGLAKVQSLLPRFVRAPYVLLVHGIEIWNNRRSDYHRSAANAKALLANSDYTRRKCMTHYADLPSIDICWPGLDLEVMGSSDADRKPAQILTVGRLAAEQQHKGHDHLIEAMARVSLELTGARLVIVGEGDDRARLEQKVLELGLQQVVEFKGRLGAEELVSMYRESTLFAMPSTGDGFGLVFLEAMANGLPCVGQAGTAADEVLDNSRCGWLVDREDIAGMASTLVDIIRDESGRRERSKLAMERYGKEFSAEVFCRRFSDYLKRWVEQAA